MRVGVWGVGFLEGWDAFRVYFRVEGVKLDSENSSGGVNLVAFVVAFVTACRGSVWGLELGVRGKVLGVRV